MVLELREFAPEGEGISPNDGRNVLLLVGEIEDYDARPRLNRQSRGYGIYGRNIRAMSIRPLA